MQAPQAEQVQIKILIKYQETQTNRMWRQARVRKTAKKGKNHKTHWEQRGNTETSVCEEGQQGPGGMNQADSHREKQRWHIRKTQKIAQNTKSLKQEVIKKTILTQEWTHPNWNQVAERGTVTVQPFVNSRAHEVHLNSHTYSVHKKRWDQNLLLNQPTSSLTDTRWQIMSSCWAVVSLKTTREEGQ